MPTSEIAARLGLSVSTVETHLAKALRACSERLAQDSEPPKDVKSPWSRLLEGDRRW
jgi:DNA-directed RNA polymerase specialized sigma24 family protein